MRKQKTYRNDRQKVLIKNIAQNTAKTSLSKEGRIEFLVKMYHAKVPSKTGEKFCSQGKTVLKYSSLNLSPEMLPKTPSTVSKHSSEKQRLNVLPTTPSMIRKQKVREKECLLKSYRREMLLETPLKVVIDKNFFGKARQKITIKKICPKSKRSPTLLFQRKPY